MIRARVEIELAKSSAGPIAAAAISEVFDELARTSDLASRWQLFAMAGYLLVHRPAAGVATVVGIFEARHVENNRRQWLAGVERARAELGDDTFERLVGQGAELSDHEAIAFLCGRDDVDPSVGQECPEVCSQATLVRVPWRPHPAL